MSYRVITDENKGNVPTDGIVSNINLIPSHASVVPIIFNQTQLDYINQGNEFITYLDPKEVKVISINGDFFKNHRTWSVNFENCALHVLVNNVYRINYSNLSADWGRFDDAYYIPNEYTFHIRADVTTIGSNDTIKFILYNPKSIPVDDVSISNIIPKYSYYDLCSGKTHTDACLCNNQTPRRIYFDAFYKNDGTTRICKNLFSNRFDTNYSPEYIRKLGIEYRHEGALYGYSHEAYNRRIAMQPGTKLTFDKNNTNDPVPDGIYAYSNKYIRRIDDDFNFGDYYEFPYSPAPAGIAYTHLVGNNSCTKIVGGVPLYNQPCNNGVIVDDPKYLYSRDLFNVVERYNATYEQILPDGFSNTTTNKITIRPRINSTTYCIRPFMVNFFYGTNRQDVCEFPTLCSCFYTAYFHADWAVGTGSSITLNNIHNYAAFRNIYNSVTNLKLKNRTTMHISYHRMCSDYDTLNNITATNRKFRLPAGQTFVQNDLLYKYNPNSPTPEPIGTGSITPQLRVKLGDDKFTALSRFSKHASSYSSSVGNELGVYRALPFNTEYYLNAEDNVKLSKKSIIKENYFTSFNNATCDSVYGDQLISAGIISGIGLDNNYNCFDLLFDFYKLWKNTYADDGGSWQENADAICNSKIASGQLSFMRVWWYGYIRDFSFGPWDPENSIWKEISVGTEMWLDVYRTRPLPTGRYAFTKIQRNGLCQFWEPNLSDNEIRDKNLDYITSYAVFQVVNGVITKIDVCPKRIEIIKANKRLDLCAGRGSLTNVYISANYSDDTTQWISNPNITIYKDTNLTIPIENSYFLTNKTSLWYENTYKKSSSYYYIFSPFKNYNAFISTRDWQYKTTNGKVTNNYNNGCFSLFAATSGSTFIRAFNSKNIIYLTPVRDILNGNVIQPETFQNIFVVKIGHYLYSDPYELIPVPDGYYFFSVGLWQNGFEIYHMVRVAGNGLITELKNYSDFDEFFITENDYIGGGGGGGTIPDQIRVYRTDDMYYAASVAELCRAELTADVSDDSYFGTVYHTEVFKDIGIELYGDNELKNYIPDGFYKIINDSVIYKVKNGQIELFDICTSNYELFFGETKEDACSNIVKTNISSKTYGVVKLGDILYANYELTTPAPSGYYRDGNYTVYSVSNSKTPGEIVDIGGCPNEYFAYYGNSRMSVCEESGDIVPIYMEQRWVLDSKVFKDINLTTPADDGYYKINHDNVILVSDGAVSWIDFCYNRINLYPGETEATACDNNTNKVNVFYKNTFDIGEFLYYDKFFIYPIVDGFYKTESDVYVVNGGKGELISYKKCNSESRLYFGETIEQTCYKNNFVDVYHIYDPFNEFNLQTKIFTDYELTIPLSNRNGYYRYFDNILSINKEGEITNILYSVSCPETIDMVYATSEKAACDSDIPKTVYFTGILKINTILYSDVEGNYPVIDGFYRNQTAVYHVRNNGKIFYVTYCPDLLNTTVKPTIPIDEDEGYCDHTTSNPPPIQSVRPARFTTKNVPSPGRVQISPDAIYPFSENISEPTTTITTTITPTTTTTNPAIDNLNTKNDLNAKKIIEDNCSFDCGGLKY
jgi:hypothetical protein